MSSLTLEVICTNAQIPPCPAAGDQEDVRVTANATDVRCKFGVMPAACPNENGPPAGIPGNDYTGEVQGRVVIRITDTLNRPPGFTSSGTVSDLPFVVRATCAATAADATIGGTCGVNTTADAVVPNVVKENKQTVVEIQQIQVNDGGSDADVDTPGPSNRPNRLFAVQGIFEP